MKPKLDKIKNLDYSSEDCQLLIREYTKLIARMAKEYDAIVIENKDLLRRLEQIEAQMRIIDEGPFSGHIKSSSVTVERDDHLIIYTCMKKLWRTLHLYGWKTTFVKLKGKLIRKNNVKRRGPF